MDTPSVAPATHPDTREHRALALYRTRGHELERIAEDLYRVPSCSGSGFYTVRYGLDAEVCDCPDFQHGGGRSCKHLLAVGIAHAKRRFTTVRTIGAAGDPFPYAGDHGGHGCYGGVVYLTYEEDGHEWLEPVPCRRCEPIQPIR